MSLEIKVDHQIDNFHLKVDLNLSQVGISSIFGPSGCGKTTLLRTIAGLNPDAKATIKVGDSIWQDEKIFLKPYERRIGYIFQEPSLFAHLNVRENILYGYKRAPNSDRVTSIEKTIKILGLENFLERDVAGLSGGEQQRVAIARAILCGPELLLMDEPLSGLDSKRKKEIMPYMESLVREFQIPVLYVTHSVDEVARLADELILMKDGKVESTGSVFKQLAKIDHDYSIYNLIQGKILKFDDILSLGTMKFGDYEFLIPGNDFTIDSEVRLQIKARDISLTLSKQENTSILNIFESKVISISDYDSGQCLIKINIADTEIRSILTKKSVEDLRLEEGQKVFAQIKSASLIG